MKLVEYNDKCYLNMDLIQAVYKGSNPLEYLYSALVNGTLFKISEKAYNIILKYGQGI